MRDRTTVQRLHLHWRRTELSSKETELSNRAVISLQDNARELWPIDKTNSCAMQARIPAGAAAQIGASDGDVLLFTNEEGVSAAARLYGPVDDAENVRLHPKVHATLVAGIGANAVTVERRDEVSLSHVVFSSSVLVATSPGESAKITEALVAGATPCTEGQDLYVWVGGAGRTLRVESCVPSVGTVTADSVVELTTRAGTGAVRGSRVSDIGGLEDTVSTLRELVEAPVTSPFIYQQLGVTPPRGVILHGPPGCGKTLLARSISSVPGVDLMFLDGPSLVSGLRGESERVIRTVFEGAVAHAPAVIVIDELDSIAPSRGKGGSQSDVRLVGALLSMMDGLHAVDGVLVIGTTNRVDAIDPALRRPGRFDRELYVPPPTAQERRDILAVHTRRMPLDVGVHEYLDSLADLTSGYVGADLAALCREAALNRVRVSRTAHEANSDLAIGREDFEAALGRTQPSLLRAASADTRPPEWRSIVGFERTKRQLRGLAALALEDVGGPLPSEGILLTGEPGSGKTLLASALADEMGANLLVLRGSDVFSRWLGESEAGIRDLFRLADQIRPSIVLLDQIDALGDGSGAIGQGEATRRVLSQLSTEIDRVTRLGGVLVVGTALEASAVDPMLRRSGRMGAEVRVPNPTRDERIALAVRHLKELSGPPSVPVADIEGLAEALADKTSGQTMADVETAVRKHCAGVFDEGDASDSSDRR